MGGWQRVRHNDSTTHRFLAPSPAATPPPPGRGPPPPARRAPGAARPRPAPRQPRQVRGGGQGGVARTVVVAFIVTPHQPRHPPPQPPPQPWWPHLAHAPRREAVAAAARPRPRPRRARTRPSRPNRRASRPTRARTTPTPRPTRPRTAAARRGTAPRRSAGEGPWREEEGGKELRADDSAEQQNRVYPRRSPLICFRASHVVQVVVQALTETLSAACPAAQGLPLCQGDRSRPPPVLPRSLARRRARMSLSCVRAQRPAAPRRARLADHAAGGAGAGRRCGGAPRSSSPP